MAGAYFSGALEAEEESEAGVVEDEAQRADSQGIGVRGRDRVVVVCAGSGHGERTGSHAKVGI